MTIRIVQTCNKCKKERNLQVKRTNGEVSAAYQNGGWRPFTEKDVCPECLDDFVKGLS